MVSILVQHLGGLLEVQVTRINNLFNVAKKLIRQAIGCGVVIGGYTTINYFDCTKN